MILDNLSGLSAYVALNPLFNEVIEFLKGHDLAALPVGKHKIKGDDVFVNIMDVQGKTPEEARMETHQKMIDIQVLVSGRERHGYAPGQQFSQAGYFEARSEEDSDYATHVVVDNTADAAKLSPKQDVEEESHYHFGR